MDVDGALSRLGKWGKWQLIHYLVLSIAVMFPASWHMLAIVFIGYMPEYTCDTPPGHTIKSIPTGEDGKLDHCKYYVNISIGDNKTEKCTSWDYHGDAGPTIVTDWDLVCDYEVLKETAQTIMVVGVMVGAMLFTFLSDTLGRKPVWFFAQFGMVVVGFLTSFVNNYYLFCVLRFVAGMLQQGIILTGFVMACELFPASMRTFAGVAIENFWAIGICVLSLFGYLVRQWEYFQMLISLLGLLTVPLLWYIPETIPWLCANDRVGEAEEVLQSAAKFNNIDLPDHVLLSADENEKCPKAQNGAQKRKIGPRHAYNYVKKQFTKKSGTSEAKYTLMDVLRNRRLLVYALIMSFLWLVISLVYYGLSLSTSNLAGNHYLNFFLSGLVEIPAYSISIIFLEKFGRRYVLAAYQITAGVALAITLFIPKETGGGVNLEPLIMTLNMIGKFGITGAFGIVFLYAPEIFPTTLRAQALGIASVGGRVGNCLAPFSSFVGRKAPWLPGILFGCLAIAAGLLTLLLPETHNRPLPQTIEDIENWFKRPEVQCTSDNNQAEVESAVVNHEMKEIDQDGKC